MIVLDTSVVIKWMVEEEKTPAARSYLDTHVSGENLVSVPELLFYELANALAFKSDLSSAETKAAFSAIWSLELESHQLEKDDYLRAAQFSDEFGISVYDAVYIALAQKLRTSVVTADAKLVKKCAELSFVELL